MHFVGGKRFTPQKPTTVTRKINIQRRRSYSYQKGHGDEYLYAPTLIWIQSVELAGQRGSNQTKLWNELLQRDLMVLRHWMSPHRRAIVVKRNDSDIIPDPAPRLVVENHAQLRRSDKPKYKRDR